MIAQGVALIAGTEQAPALQLGHDEACHRLKGAGQAGGGDHEPVAGAGLEPGLHLIHHLAGGAHEAQRLAQGGSMAGHFPQGDGPVPQVLLDASHIAVHAGGRVQEGFGNGLVQLEAGEIKVGCLRQQHDRCHRLDQIEQELLLAAGLRFGFGHHQVGQGQDPHLLGVPAGRGNLGFLVAVVGHGPVQIRGVGEHHIGPTRSETLASSR